MQIDFFKMNETMINSMEQKQVVVPASTTGALQKSFGDYLKENMSHVNDLQLETRRLSEQFAMGELENVHDLMISSEKSGLALKTANTMRKKVLEIYREVSQTRL
ncbi:MAG: flagellar hook-basal body complex protein FliE [Candidatus Cloacimonetes bacterium]|nr:flagellar hook-basal body complex protein FliE [Candidatus Cloacimonadota bacterium]